MEKNDSAIQNIMLDSIIWYNLIDRVLTANGDNWYHTQQDPASYADDRLFNTLVTLIILGLKQAEFHYKKDSDRIKEYFFKESFLLGYENEVFLFVYISS